jgi:hypothetical protein
MSDNKGGGRGPQPDNDKKPAQQTDESAGNIKGPQEEGNRQRERWDISRGAEPSSMGSARNR